MKILVNSETREIQVEKFREREREREGGSN